MPSSPLPIPPPSPEEFRPENFKKKSGFRDYLIYLVVLIILLGAGGGAYYYFTRSPDEQRQLQAKVSHAVGKDMAAENAKNEKVKRKQLNLGGVLEGETEAANATPEAKAVTRKAEAVSAYGGGGQSVVLAADNAQLPPASPEFSKFVTSLKVSGVLQGNPAKAMLNGRMFRAGAVIEPEMGVSFVGVDSVNKFLVFHDKTGAELHLTY